MLASFVRSFAFGGSPGCSLSKPLMKKIAKMVKDKLLEEAPEKRNEEEEKAFKYILFSHFPGIVKKSFPQEVKDKIKLENILEGIVGQPKVVNFLDEAKFVTFLENKLFENFMDNDNLNIITWKMWRSCPGSHGNWIESIYVGENYQALKLLLKAEIGAKNLGFTLDRIVVSLKVPKKQKMIDLLIWVDANSVWKSPSENVIQDVKEKLILDSNWEAVAQLIKKAPYERLGDMSWKNLASMCEALKATSLTDEKMQRFIGGSYASKKHSKLKKGEKKDCLNIFNRLITLNLDIALQPFFDNNYDALLDQGKLDVAFSSYLNNMVPQKENQGIVEKFREAGAKSHPKSPQISSKSPPKQPTPEPPKEPTPEPPKEAASELPKEESKQEPPKQPTPEPPKEATPELPKEESKQELPKQPTPEPPKEPTPELPKKESSKEELKQESPKKVPGQLTLPEQSSTPEPEPETETEIKPGTWYKRRDVQVISGLAIAISIAGAIYYFVFPLQKKPHKKKKLDRRPRGKLA